VIGPGALGMTLWQVGIGVNNGSGSSRPFAVPGDRTRSRRSRRYQGVGIVPAFYEPVKLWFGLVQ
jgi:hypothetical protein